MFSTEGIALIPGLVQLNWEPDKSSLSNARGATGQGTQGECCVQERINLKKKVPREKKKKRKRGEIPPYFIYQKTLQRGLPNLAWGEN